MMARMAPMMPNAGTTRPEVQHQSVERATGRSPKAPFTSRLVLGLALAAGGSCIVDESPRYCDANTPCMDASRPFCDVEGEYRASGGARNQCIPEPGCQRGRCESDAPVCDIVSETCVGCREDEDCAGFEETGVCGIDGACVGCGEHAQCESDACNPLTGQCASEDEVLYVNSTVEAGAGDCTKSFPCDDLIRVVPLVSPTRSIVRMVQGNYTGSFTFELASVMILADPGTILTRVPGEPTETLVVGAGTDLFLQGLIVRGAGNANGDVPAIRCENYLAKGETRLRLDLALVSAAPGSGIDAQNCAVEITRTVISENRFGISAAGGRVDVSRSEIAENTDGAMLVSGSALTFRNNIVWGNGAAADDLPPVALLLDLAAGSAFEHNTLVRNIVPNGLPALECSGDLTLTNNIIYDNGDGPQVAGCSHRSSLIGPVPHEDQRSEAPIFLDPGSDDFHLDPSSPGVDEGEPSDVHEDVDGDVRPQGAAPDIGADELAP